MVTIWEMIVAMAGGFGLLLPVLPAPGLYLQSSVQEFLELVVLTEDFEQFDTVHLFLLLESLEYDILRRVSFIGNGTLNEVIIVSTHRAESSSSANILMKLVLKINE